MREDFIRTEMDSPNGNKEFKLYETKQKKALLRIPQICLFAFVLSSAPGRTV